MDSWNRKIRSVRFGTNIFKKAGILSNLLWGAHDLPRITEHMGGTAHDMNGYPVSISQVHLARWEADEMEKLWGNGGITTSRKRKETGRKNWSSLTHTPSSRCLEKLTETSVQRPMTQKICRWKLRAYGTSWPKYSLLQVAARLNHPTGSKTVLMKIEFYNKMCVLPQRGNHLCHLKSAKFDVQIWVFFGEIVFSLQ